MANLNAQTISTGVDWILSVENGIDSSTARQVKDGDGTVSPFYLTTTKVGIGTDSPYAPFHVVGAGAGGVSDTSSNIPVALFEGTSGSAGSSNPIVCLHNSSESPADDEYIGAIVFTAGDSGDSTPVNPSEGDTYASIVARIIDETETSTAGQIALRVSTNDSTAVANGLTVKGATGGGVFVGLGTDSPSETFHLKNTTGGNSECKFVMDGADMAIQLINATNTWSFGADNAPDRFVIADGTGLSSGEKLVVQSNGYVGIGATAPGAMLEIHPDSDVVNGLTIKDSDGSCDTNNKLINLDYSGDDDLDGAKFIIFQDSDGIIGSISGDGATTTYATSSDYRLKTDCKDIVDATGTINQLKLYDFAWKKNTSKRSMGVFAHEAQAIVPSAVIGTKDAKTPKEYTDESGDIQTKDVIDAQGIDYSKFVPLLLKAVQELSAKVTALESK